MTLYLSTFTSGLQALVKEQLKQSLKSLKIKDVLDGSILFESNDNIQKIRSLKFVNNTFLVLDTLKITHSKQKDAFVQIFNSFLRGGTKGKLAIALKNLPITFKTYRVIFSNENTYVTQENILFKRVQEQLKHWLGETIKNTSHKPQAEFWFLIRREGLGFFMLKITKDKDKIKPLKGELPISLVYTMCYLSEPDSKDIVLDPFAGSGIIPIIRAKYFDYDMIFASDINKNFKIAIKNNIKKYGLKQPIIYKIYNATQLSYLQDNFVHKIITDPPWGFYEKIKDIKAFYKKFIKEFIRVLRPNGIIVLLVSREIELSAMLRQYENKLKLMDKYNILVAGKKASIYKLKKY